MNHKILKFLKEWKINENRIKANISFPIRINNDWMDEDILVLNTTLIIDIKYCQSIDFKIQIRLNGDKFEKLICKNLEIEDPYLETINKLKSDLEKLYG
jgi:hypothetical protein